MHIPLSMQLVVAKASFLCHFLSITFQYLRSSLCDILNTSLATNEAHHPTMRSPLKKSSLALYAFPNIRNTIFVLVPKSWDAIFRSSSSYQKLEIDFLVSIPNVRNRSPKLGIRAGMEYQCWENMYLLTPSLLHILLHRILALSSHSASPSHS